MLIVLVFVLQPLSVNSSWSTGVVFAVQAIALALPGIPALSATIAARTAQISREPMVTAGIVAGADARHLLRWYYLPSLLPGNGRRRSRGA